MAKMPSTSFASQRVIMSNDLQAQISLYCNWHWLLTAGTNIAIASGTQDYTMAAGDQNKVQAIHDANLLEGSTEQPQLDVYSFNCFDKSSTTGQPMGVCIISPTVLRLWPTPDATYTFQWRYFARPIVFTGITDTYQCPDSFDNVVVNGVIWKLFTLADDDRAEGQYKKFHEQLEELKQSELRTMGRWKI